MIVGTVQKIDRDQFQIKGREGLVTLHIDEKTTVANGKKLNDLSVLAVGDDVRVNYYGDATPTAVNVSAKVTVSGMISQAAKSQLTIVQGSSDDTPPLGRKVSVFVFLNATTNFGAARDQLKVGRRVHVIGWDTGDGVVEAEKIALN